MILTTELRGGSGCAGGTCRRGGYLAVLTRDFRVRDRSRRKGESGSAPAAAAAAAPAAAGPQPSCPLSPIANLSLARTRNLYVLSFQLFLFHSLRSFIRSLSFTYIRSRPSRLIYAPPTQFCRRHYTAKE